MRDIESLIYNFQLPSYPSRIYKMQKGWELFKNFGDHIFFGKNHVIASPGDKIDCCYLILEGRVVSMEYTPEGEEHIFNIFEKGSIFLETNLMLDIPSAVYFKTISPAEMVGITKDRLVEEMTADYEIVNFIIQGMAYKYYSAMDQIRENYNHDAMWRVYNLLQIFASNFGTRKGDWIMINMKLSQQMISNLLGINRITIVKVIKEMKEKDVIALINGYYCVHETNKLRK